MPIWEDSKYDSVYNTIAPAYQGWSRAQALADFHEARGGDLSRLPGQYGDQLRLSSSPKPSFDLQGTYDRLFKTPEIDTLTGAISKINNDVTSREEALNEQTSIINDNPFYSEGTRLGRVAKLTDRAQNDINTVLKKGQNYQNQLALAKADAETQMNLALKQYDISRTEYQDNLQRFNMLLSSGAMANASPQDLAQLSISTGISPSMIDSIIKTQRDTAAANAVKPQVITSTDDSGNVTFSVIDANTGNIINQQSLGQIDKKTKQSSGKSASEKPITLQQASQAVQMDLLSVAGGDGKVSEGDYLAARSQWAALGLSPSEFDELFGMSFVNPRYYESYQIVNKNVENALRRIR